jgi:hypothetical protein
VPAPSPPPDQPVHSAAHPSGRLHACTHRHPCHRELPAGSARPRGAGWVIQVQRPPQGPAGGDRAGWAVIAGSGTEWEGRDAHAGASVPVPGPPAISVGAGFPVGESAAAGVLPSLVTSPRPFAGPLPPPQLWVHLQHQPPSSRPAIATGLGPDASGSGPGSIPRLRGLPAAVARPRHHCSPPAQGRRSPPAAPRS